jgi:iron complex transport system substrate-binding protein
MKAPRIILSGIIAVIAGGFASGRLDNSIMPLHQAFAFDQARENQQPAFRTITDMANRKVTIPTKISKIICNGNPLSAACFMVAPEMLLLTMGGPSKDGAKYIPEQFRNIPSSGMGERGGSNYESYIALNPDLIFDGCGKIGGESVSGNPLASLEIMQEKLGSIPVVCLDSDISNYEATLKFMGEVLNVRERTNAFIAYYRDVLREVQAKTSSIPQSKRVRVYYAEGNDGLQTDPVGSRHTQLIEFCGAINVAGKDLKGGGNASSVSVTKESLLMWNPDVIITSSANLIKQMYADGTWLETKALRTHRIYMIPTKPYNWFDRPPGANRIVGIPWAAHAFYPNLFTDDWFKKKVKEFYKLFYQFDLSDADLAALTTP